MAGFNVNRPLLDQKAAEAVIAVREALDRVSIVNDFLASVPADAPGGDPLTLSTTPTDSANPNSAPGKFGYTEDEAYLLRYLFGGLDSIDVGALLQDGRKLTGLS